MPTFKQKNVIKSYKLRLQEKLKTVSEETEHATTFLNNCLLEFSKRVEHILSIKDEKCLSLYRKLIRDLENYSEKLFILQASLEEVTEEESDSSEDEDSSHSRSNEVASTNISTPQKIQLLPATSTTVAEFDDESHRIKSESIHIVSASENTSLPTSLCDASEIHNRLYDMKEKSTYGAESNIACESESEPIYGAEKNILSDYPSECGGSITEDDFYSVHSEVIEHTASSAFLANSEMDKIHSEPAHENKCESNQSFSQSSCYRSLSSNISDSVAFYNENKNLQSFASQSAAIKDLSNVESQQKSLGYKKINLTIMPPVIKVPSNISATLSHIIDPGDFWIQLENSHGSDLNFPKIECIHLNCLTSIKEGDYCLAPFRSSPFYYRAQSLSCAESGRDKVKVIFIDHGSMQEMLLSDLKPLPLSSYDIPSQAVHCYLYGIKPVDGSWTSECIETFKEFQNLCIEVAIKSKEHLYGVQLTTTISADLDEDFSVDIAQSLCLDGLAVSLNETLPKFVCSSDERFESQPSQPFCLSLEESELHDMNAISNDSGVSVTSAYKSSQISSSDRTENQVLKLSSSLSACHICDKCKNHNFCWHLKIPPPSVVFVEKNMMIVMLSHIVNPHEFYVNMAMEEIVTLDELRDQMTSTYESHIRGGGLIPRKIDEFSEDMLCAGRFYEDDYWYRVKILRLSVEDKKEGQVLVQYVDYGNTAKIKCSDLLPLTSEFSEHPAFAVSCCLANVTPLDGSSTWDEKAISAFKQLTNFDRCLTAQILNESPLDDRIIYNVLLWDTEDSRDLLINLALADNGVAIFDYNINTSLPSKKKAEKASSDMEYLNSWNPMSEEYHEIENSYAVSDDDIEVAVTGYKAKDEEYTCKYYSLRGYCPRGDNCPYEHLPLLECGVTRDREAVVCIDSLPVIPETANNILVQVSSIINPGHFYVILPFGCKTVDQIDDLVYQGTAYEEIINTEAKRLFYTLDKYYSKIPFQEITTVALSIGTIVAAKRKWDMKWHRGRVVDVLDVAGPAKIFFVDSGDHEWVPRKFIRTISTQFLNVPFQAIQCSLYGIEPVGAKEGQNWPLEAINFFRKSVDGAILLADIVLRLGEVLHVTLRRTSKNNHQDIGQQLVSRKFAVCCPVMQSSKKEIMFVPG